MKAYEFTSKATGDVYVTEGADMQAAYDALPEGFDKTAGTLAYALEAATSSEVAAEIVAKAATKTRARVHFMASEYGSRAACGRQVLGWRIDAPRWSSKPEEVTCPACIATGVCS